MVRVFVPLPSRHCKYASLAPSGGSGMSVEKEFCFPKACRKGASCAGWRRRRKSGNAYLLQKDSVSLHTFSCQIEKKRCFQQSVFPLSGRFPVTCGRSSFFLLRKKVFFQPNGKFFSWEQSLIGLKSGLMGLKKRAKP